VTVFDYEAIERAFQEYDSISAELDTAWRALRQVAPGSSQHEVIHERIVELLERKVAVGEQLQALGVDKLREQLRSLPVSPEEREAALTRAIHDLEQMRADVTGDAASALDVTLGELDRRLRALRSDRPSPN
jgi:hypothetical protein